MFGLLALGVECPGVKDQEFVVLETELLVEFLPRDWLYQNPALKLEAVKVDHHGEWLQIGINWLDGLFKDCLQLYVGFLFDIGPDYWIQTDPSLKIRGLNELLKNRMSSGGFLLYSLYILVAFSYDFA